MNPSNNVITVQSISKYIAEQTILESVSFRITQGELVSLIGPNGAGKSTLIKIILGLDPEYHGTVTIPHTERVQYIPQLSDSDATQLPLSVQEYLAIATTSFYRQQAGPVDTVQALRHVGVDPTKLSQSWYSLSGGERQRIAIARALLTNPTLLILDEPLAAVDFASRSGLYELLRHLQQDHAITMLLVSHDTDSVVPLSDRILCLNRRLHTDCIPTHFPHTHEPTTTTPITHHC